MSIPLPTDFSRIWHVVKSSRNSFIVSHTRASDKQNVISEISPDAKEIFRTFEPSSVHEGVSWVGLSVKEGKVTVSEDQSKKETPAPAWPTQNLEAKDWLPRHLAIDEDGKIFVADVNNQRLFLFNSELGNIRIIMDEGVHKIDKPTRLCYIREKQQLIVGQWSMLDSNSPTVTSVSLFKLRPLTTDWFKRNKSHCGLVGSALVWLQDFIAHWHAINSVVGSHTDTKPQCHM